MAGSESSDLLVVFREAALSVTKLYKTAASAQAKARSQGYQECLDDLLSYLDRENIGVDDGEGWRIRRWATERLDDPEGAAGEGRASDAREETVAQEPADSSVSSSDEDTTTTTTTQRLVGAASPDAARRVPRKKSPTSSRHPSPQEDMLSSGELQRDNSMTSASTRRPTVRSVTPAVSGTHTPTETNKQTSGSIPMEIIPPSMDTFDFRATQQYPNIATLDLSDVGQQQPSRTEQATNTTVTTPRSHSTHRSKMRHLHGHDRHRNRSSPHHARASAGQKRKFEFQDFFDIGNVKEFGTGGGGGGGKPGGGGKRSRHA